METKPAIVLPPQKVKFDTEFRILVFQQYNIAAIKSDQGNPDSNPPSHNAHWVTLGQSHSLSAFPVLQRRHENKTEEW